MKTVLKVHIALIMVNLIYGANYTIAKEVMPYYVEPFGFIILRVVGAVTLFTLIHFFFIKEKVKRKDFMRLFFCGVFGVALNQLLFFKGLNITTPINASLIMVTAPITVTLLSYFLAMEMLTSKKVIGVGLGAFGAFLILYWGKHIAISAETFLGDLLVLINACSYATYLVIVKPLMKKYHPITVIKWVFTFGMLFVIPAGYEELSRVEWCTMPLNIWLSVGYVVLFTTFFAYLLNIYALSKANPSLVGIYIYSQPVIATAIALAFAKDELNWIKVMAAGLIFLGVFLVSKKPSKVKG